MKIQIKLMLILVSISTCTFAQDEYEDGYVILNSGDTLKGQIKAYSMTALGMYQRVKFQKDDEKSQFTPEQIKYYRVGNQRYVTWEIGEKNPEKVFLKIHTKGYCTLFESRIYHGMSTNAFGGAYSNTTHTFFLFREGEKLHTVIFPYLKQGRDLYFIDNIQLTYDIRNGRYRREQLVDIVKRYNKERIDP